MFEDDRLNSDEIQIVHSGVLDSSNEGAGSFNNQNDFSNDLENSRNES